jgi:hypothetical protein
VLVKTLSGDPKLVGFAQDESQVGLREQDGGCLEARLPLTAEFVVVDAAALDGPRVKFFASYSIADDTWSEFLDVKLPAPRPMATWA